MSQDKTSSVYSRSPELPKTFFLPPLAPTDNHQHPTQHDLPEINPLDHQIALAHGSTMALETTRTRLQRAKTDQPLSLHQSRLEKLRQWKVQEEENRFYCECLKSFQELSKIALGTCQDLLLQYCFEPEVSPVDNARVLKAVEKLRTALEQSRRLEDQAEHQYKHQWSIPRIGGPSTKWI